MRFVTFQTDHGHAHVGVLAPGGSNIIDLTLWMSRTTEGELHTHSDLVDLIAEGESFLRVAEAALGEPEESHALSGVLVPLTEERLLAPIPRPRKNVFCMGRNYAEHAAESSRAFGSDSLNVRDKPAHPAIFTKAPTTVTGPYSDISFDPEVSSEIDWEIELAVVIGRTGKNIRKEDALAHVFGYMVLNDISARDIQRRHGNQFFKGKSLDGACPTGPWIVTPDEVGDPDNLALRLSVNGADKQRDNTSSMFFSVSDIIEIMSFGMTLEPGDIIATGTPAGVGFARNPPEFLKPGDIVEGEVEKVGRIRNRVV